MRLSFRLPDAAAEFASLTKMDMKRFENKVAIVTGGASGIVRALCEGLGQRGAAMVIVADINVDRAQKVASSITAAGGHDSPADGF